MYIAASALGRLGSIVLIPIYTRKLSPETFGTLSLANSVQALIPSLFSLGLTSLLAKVYFDTPAGMEPEARGGVAARWLVGLVLGSTLVASTAVALLWPDTGLGGFTARQVLLVLGAGAGAAFTAIPDVWYRARRSKWSVAALNLMAFSSNVAIAIWLVVGLERGLDGVLEANCLSALATGAWGLIFMVRVLRGALDETHRPRFGSTLKFALPFIPNTLAAWAFSFGDRWTLKSINAEALLGVYALGQQLASPIPIVSAALNDSEAAAMGQAYRERGAETLEPSARRQLKRMALVAMLPYLALLGAIPLLDWVLKPAYDPALVLLPFVGLAAVFEVPYYPGTNMLFYTGRTRLIPVLTTASAIVNMGLAAGLTWAFELPGLIAARLLGSAIRSTLFWVLARQETQARAR